MFFQAFFYLQVRFHVLLALYANANNRHKMPPILAYHILSCVVRTFFYLENDAEISPAHYTCKVADKGFKMVFMMNKLAMVRFKSCEILEL